MINDTVEVDLTRETIIARLNEYMANTVKGRNLDRVADVLLAFMDLDPDNGGYCASDRALFIKGISALVCGECGKPSCLCGYPDC